MAVVEIDAVYCKPFTTNAIQISPGQTKNVLVKAHKTPSRYFMAATPFMVAPIAVYNKTTTAIYNTKASQSLWSQFFLNCLRQMMLNLLVDFPDKLKSLSSLQFPDKVPLDIDRNLFYTVILGMESCLTCLNST